VVDRGSRENQKILFLERECGVEREMEGIWRCGRCNRVVEKMVGGGRLVARVEEVEE